LITKSTGGSFPLLFGTRKRGERPPKRLGAAQKTIAQDAGSRSGGGEGLEAQGFERGEKNRVFLREKRKLIA